MNNFWNNAAQKYLDNVFYRRELEAQAAKGDRFAASVITTAASIAK